MRGGKSHMRKKEPKVITPIELEKVLTEIKEDPKHRKLLECILNSERKEPNNYEKMSCYNSWILYLSNLKKINQTYVENIKAYFGEKIPSQFEKLYYARIQLEGLRDKFRRGEITAQELDRLKDFETKFTNSDTEKGLVINNIEERSENFEKKRSKVKARGDEGLSRD